MKVLYICTHNRCRSVLSEAVTNHFGGDRLTARSAGSQPVDEVHPLTLRHLREAGIAVEGLRSKSWDELEDFAPDLVITVCDRAAGESCPVWFGKAIRLHWSLADPSSLSGSPDEVAEAFRNTIGIIKRRVDMLIPVSALPRDQWRCAIDSLQLD